jgi:hypothetical protein
MWSSVRRYDVFWMSVRKLNTSREVAKYAGGVFTCMVDIGDPMQRERSDSRVGKLEVIDSLLRWENELSGSVAGREGGGMGLASLDTSTFVRTGIPARDSIMRGLMWQL